jgi:hypothetical protein
MRVQPMAGTGPPQPSGLQVVDRAHAVRAGAGRYLVLVAPDRGKAVGP